MLSQNVCDTAIDYWVRRAALRLPLLTVSLRVFPRRATANAGHFIRPTILGYPGTIVTINRFMAVETDTGM